MRDTKEREVERDKTKVDQGDVGKGWRQEKKVMNEMMRMRRIELFLETDRYSFLWKERGVGTDAESKKGER